MKKFTFLQIKFARRGAARPQRWAAKPSPGPPPCFHRLTPAPRRPLVPGAAPAPRQRRSDNFRGTPPAPALPAPLPSPPHDTERRRGGAPRDRPAAPQLSRRAGQVRGSAPLPSPPPAPSPRPPPRAPPARAPSLRAAGGERRSVRRRRQQAGPRLLGAADRKSTANFFFSLFFFPLHPAQPQPVQK